MSETSPRDPGVVYVLGYGRSGSTLVDVLLGNLPGVLSVGELDQLQRDWEGGACSCGEPYAACPFWSAVEPRVLAAGAPASPAAREAILRRVERVSALPALLLGLVPAGHAADYRTLVRAQVEALAGVGHRSWILDSSKSAREAAGRAIAMRRLAGLPVRCVHVVRDGRAVIWSVRRGDNVKLADGAAGAAAGFSWPTARAIWGWCLANTIALVVRAVSPRGTALLLRYEDLVRDPETEIERVAAFLGVDGAEVRRRLRDGEDFPVGHNTGGNRLRQGGAVRLRVDREWESRLRRRDRVAFWLFAWPLALLFGYAGRR